jgi:2-(3-amino-3-carboxypropyl)histidine synthase
MSSIDLHLPEVAAKVRAKGARRVALQLPEGLKVRALEAAAYISRETGAEVMVLGDACFGACDVDASALRYVDVLVHFGHAPMPVLKCPDNVIFQEVRLPMDIEQGLENALPLLYGRVGLITAVQHLDCLGQARSFLEGRGFAVLLGRGDGRIQWPGQVLGCNISGPQEIAEDVDCFLFIGTGNFHPLAVAIGTGKRVIRLDPYTQEAEELGELHERILRQRFGVITAAKEAKTFLILVSSKVGQERMPLAREIAEDIRAHGRQATILVMNEFRPDALLPYYVDAYVNTACPRIAIDDQARYKKPMLTPVELEIVLGERDWDDYRMDVI